jgi:hypothetical protein
MKPITLTVNYAQVILGDLLRWRDAAIEQRDRKRAAELALLIRQHAGLMAYWQVFGHAYGF